jgi:hypothetical protein
MNLHWIELAIQPVATSSVPEWKYFYILALSYKVYTATFNQGIEVSLSIDGTYASTITLSPKHNMGEKHGSRHIAVVAGRADSGDHHSLAVLRTMRR